MHRRAGAATGSPPPFPSPSPSSTAGAPHGALVVVLAGAIVVLLCGAAATLVTRTPEPASAVLSGVGRARTPMAWDNAALAPAGETTVEAPPPSLPSRLRMPTIGVDAAVGATGIGKDGELVVPDDFANAFWFDGSAVPGDPGVSVLVGHIDDENGPAVFYPLERLKPGQEVLIARTDGVTARYIVTELRVFSKGRFPTERVFGSASGPGLRLITCIGRFDRRRQTYLDNLVVFASPADPIPAPAAA